MIEYLKSLFKKKRKRTLKKRKKRVMKVEEEKHPSHFFKVGGTD